MTNPRVKLALIMVWWIVSGFAFGMLALTVSNAFIVGVLISLFVSDALSKKIRCLRCGHPLTYNPIRVFGTPIFFWGPWIPRCCSRCGQPIAGSGPATEAPPSKPDVKQDGEERPDRSATSPRRTIYLTYAAMVLTSITHGILVFVLSQHWPILPMMVLSGLIIVFLLTRRCPRCRTPILLSGAGMGDSARAFHVVVPKICLSCKCPL